ncbi:MAG: methyltransferase domain-containing protein [Polyangiaceae bacterium]|nr:methyltransferase domain-containing protein [Polyangiaceae bacterium]
MEPDFWRERWEKQQIGFHEGGPNALLEEFGYRLLPANASAAAASQRPRVLVPLCGKSRDLRWLHAKGFEVVGIELVRSAAQAFFEENELVGRSEGWYGYESLAGDGIRIVVGDVFELGAIPAGSFDAVYDRAALVALRREDRERYVEQLLKWVTAKAKLLVITFVYDSAKMNGPPFSVTDAELAALYSHASTLEQLADRDILEKEPRFKERGLDALNEKAWLVTRHVAG